MLPGCAHGGGCAALTLPQHGQASSGSRYSVTNFVMVTSQTCDHQVPARSAPSSPVPQREHSAGGGSSSRLSGSGARDSPVPACPGCPPRLRSARRSRSEDCRAFRSALRRSLASMDSLDGGVPDGVLSDPSRRSSSATFSSSRRRSSRSASSSARSTAISPSLASITARNRASSSRGSPASAGRPGVPGTRPDLAQPQREIQLPHTACRITRSTRGPPEWTRPYGIAGSAVIHLFRLVEAPALTAEPAHQRGDFALIVSDYLFVEIIGSSPAPLDPPFFQHIPVEHKETRSRGWIWLQSSDQASQQSSANWLG